MKQWLQWRPVHCMLIVHSNYDMWILWTVVYGSMLFVYFFSDTSWLIQQSSLNPSQPSCRLLIDVGLPAGLGLRIPISPVLGTWSDEGGGILLGKWFPFNTELYPDVRRFDVKPFNCPPIASVPTGLHMQRDVEQCSCIGLSSTFASCYGADKFGKGEMLFYKFFFITMAI